MKIQIGELSGSESITLETIHDKKDLVTLSEVSKDILMQRKQALVLQKIIKVKNSLFGKLPL